MLKLDNLKIGKKGISSMIGYILLITMAIALAILVFNWLSHYVPEEDPTEDICPEGVSLSLRNIVCDSGQTELSFTIRNNGLFSVDGFRVGVNDKEGSELGVYTIETSGASISPESEYNFLYDYGSHVEGISAPSFESNLRLVEVRPYVLGDDGTERVCPSIIETLSCDIQEEVCIGGLDEDRDGFIDCEDFSCLYDQFCSEFNSDILVHLSFNNPNDLVTRLKDYSSYGNDGVFMGGTKYDYRSDEGYDGRGAYFMDHSVPDNNKTALQLLTPEFANGLSNDFTISMLIKPGTGGSGNAVFFSRSCSTHWCLRIDQEEFGYTPNGQAVDFFSDRTLSNRLPNVKNIVGVDFRRWYHLVGVWNTGDGTARYYINGQETNITGYDANFSSVDRAVAFGADVGATVPNVNQETYKGWVDDLIILNSSLSASDVSDMFRYYDEHTPCAFETDYPLVECP